MSITAQGGVPKYPALRAHAGPLGLEGDRQRNPWIHGGRKQALLIITEEGLDELKAQGFPVYPGALGENITTKGLDRHSLRLGMRLRIGQALVELTKMRQPCNTLNVYGAGTIQPAVFDLDVKKGNAESPRWGLAGFYAAVLETGWIAPGDPVAVIE